jgi:hypothetical protein
MCWVSFLSYVRLFVCPSESLAPSNYSRFTSSPPPRIGSILPSPRILMNGQPSGPIPYCDSTFCESWQLTSEILSPPRGEWITREPPFGNPGCCCVPNATSRFRKCVCFRLLPFLWNQPNILFIYPVIVHLKPNTTHSLDHQVYGPKFPLYPP